MKPSRKTTIKGGQQEKRPTSGEGNARKKGRASDAKRSDGVTAVEEKTEGGEPTEYENTRRAGPPPEGGKDPAANRNYINWEKKKTTNDSISASERGQSPDAGGRLDKKGGGEKNDG